MEQKPETTVNSNNALLQLPTEILLYIASLLKDSDPDHPNASLLALGLVARRLRSIMLEKFWNDIVRSGPRSKLLQFLRKQMFYLRSLDQPYYIELDSKINPRLGVSRLIALRHGVDRLVQVHGIPTVLGPPIEYSTATRSDFKTTTAYHAYLLANPTNDYLKSDDHWLEADEKGQTLAQLFTRAVTVFHALCLLEFDPHCHLLDTMFEQGTKLPAPFRVKEDFETVAAYFEYLINHIHDLYATLRTNPNLINVQDEQGKTLLFYVPHAVKYLPRDKILWLVHILVTTPNINVNLADIEGNTFLHTATMHCADDAGKIFEHQESIIFSLVFVPFLNCAAKNNFDFQRLNKTGFSVLHLAAKTPSQTNVWGFCGGPREPRELQLIVKLSTNKSIDFNQLSLEGCTALYYAIACSHRSHIHSMLSYCEFKTTAQRKVFQLLRDKLVGMSRGLIIKLQQPHAKIGSTIVNEHARRAAYYRILKLVHIKATDNNYNQKLDLKWPTTHYIINVVTRFRALGSPNFLNEETNRLICDLELVVKGDSDAESLNCKIWNFLNGTSTSSPLFKILIEAAQEEAEQFIVDVTKMTEPFVETNPKPITDYFKARPRSDSAERREEEKNCDFGPDTKSI